MPRKSITFKRSLLKAVVNTVVATAFAGAALVVSAQHSEPAEVTNPNLTAPSYTERLIERKCEPVAEGTIPGHVVVTAPGDIAARYYGQEMADKALNQQFGDKPAGLTIHAFCR
jgi:hypothetical protein